MKMYYTIIVFLIIFKRNRCRNFDIRFKIKK